MYGAEIHFEPDEERNYRAMIDPQTLCGKKLDIALLHAIADAIVAIIK
jgi:hypothetical protein